MFTKLYLLLILISAFLLNAAFANGSATPFPEMGGVGEVPAESGQFSLGACSVAVKLSARGLQLRNRPGLGELAMPSYPASLFAAGIVGEAEVKFTLAKDGRIADAQVTRASDPEFGVSALATVRRWKFQPLKWIKEPKDILVSATFIFSIYYD